MSHRKSHGGFASQAVRRDEDWIACVDCTPHTFSRQQATPVEPEEQWGPVKFWTVVVFALAFVCGIALWAGIGQAVPA